MPPCGVWKRIAVPAANLNEVIAEFNLDNPVRVEKVQNPDGTYDVTATFPPCPDGSASNENSE